MNYFWPIYKNLEDEVIDLSKYIHISDKQLEVYSMHIGDLIVRCATEIEALSKELYRDHGGVIPLDKNGDERYLYFDTDCIAFLNSIWNICEKEIYITTHKFFFEGESCIRTPLKKANKRGSSSSAWNKAYQSIKHDRKNNLRKGNINNLLDALGALYILNIYYLDEKFSYNKVENGYKFDNRIGSEVFSVKYVDISNSFDIKEEKPFLYIPESKIDELKKAVYVMKFTPDEWEKIVNDYEKSIDDWREKIVTSPAFIDYYSNNPGEAENINKETLITLSNKFLGKEYISNGTLFYSYGKRFIYGSRECVLYKNQDFYK